MMRMLAVIVAIFTLMMVVAHTYLLRQGQKIATLTLQESRLHQLLEKDRALELLLGQMIRAPYHDPVFLHAIIQQAHQTLEQLRECRLLLENGLYPCGEMMRGKISHFEALAGIQRELSMRTEAIEGGFSSLLVLPHFEKKRELIGMLYEVRHGMGQALAQAKPINQEALEPLFSFDHRVIPEVYHKQWMEFLEQVRSVPELHARLLGKAEEIQRIPVELALLEDMQTIREAREQFERFNRYEEMGSTVAFLLLGGLLLWLLRRGHREMLHRLRQEQVLTYQSRLASMGEMIGAIAHQWKQPLSIVSMHALAIGEDYAEEIGDAHDLKARIGKSASAIVAQVKFMSETIDDFRNFFKPMHDSVSFSPVEILERLLSLVKSHLMHRRVEVAVEVEQPFWVKGRPNELMQVLLNLINNAIEAIGKEGVIRVSFQREGNKGIIRVRDTGGGIPSELLPEKIFEAHVSTKGEKGTGIGLSLSRNIIEGHFGGNLSARNVHGGAEFILMLPLFLGNEQRGDAA